jgi:lipopolysaccharide/colanic/teichoic acid biosynthesis glycosyltransferase
MALVLLAPLFGLVAIAVLLAMGRPILFRQRRHGTWQAFVY